MRSLLKKTLSFILAAVLASTSIYVMAGSDGSPDGYDSWDDFYESLMGTGESENSDYIPEINEMKLLANEKGAELYFYEKENIFYIKCGDNLWSSIIQPEQISTENLDATESRGLFSVKVSDKQNAVQTFEFVSGATSDFDVTYDYSDNAVTLHISIPSVLIAFDAVVGLDKNGLYCTIPDASIEENEEYKLFSITVLPCFGAAAVTDDGYIAYVDGSGALIDFSGRKAPTRTLYTYQVWGGENADIDTILSNEENDIHSVLMPVAGIKHTDGACVAAVTSGEEIATLNILYDDYYNAYFSFEYRTFYNASYNFTGSVFDEKTITTLSSRRAKGKDCTIRWFILNGKNNTYSDMAVRYREYLDDSESIGKNNESHTIPISMDVFMCIEKSNFLGESVISLTDYEETLEMLKNLEAAGVESADVRLMGWSKGGYTAMPTAFSDDNKSGKIKSLQEYCNSNGISLYKEAEFIKAYADASGYNLQKQSLRDCIQQIVKDKKEEQLFLSPRKFFKNKIAEWNKKTTNGICLSSIGNLLISGYDSDGELNRSEVLKFYLNGLEKLEENGTETAIVGGNSYVLSYADRLYDIPDTDSGYYQNTRTIPFYQIVLHGYTDYSSLAGNRSFDLEFQKLKWIETGSLPHYFITGASSVEFQDTDYNTVFSSKFEDYSEIISNIYQEFNDNFGAFWYEPISLHEYISKDVVKVVYGSEHSVIINYGDRDITIDGKQISSKNYIVTEVKNR